MNTRALLEAFERADLPEGLRHADHIRLAWLHIRRDGLTAATLRMCEGLRRLANAHGVPGKYHHTMTCAWVHLVAHAVHESSSPDSFETLVAECPALLDRHALSAWYSSAMFDSEAARTRWIEPDLHPLPPLPADVRTS